MEVVILKLFKALAILGFLGIIAGIAKADNYMVPRDAQGITPGDVKLVGVEVIDSTGIRAYGVTVPSVLYWINTSSTPVLQIILRDTDTLNTSSHSNLMVQLPPTQGTNRLTIFDPPIIFNNGMCIQQDVVGLTGGRTSYGFRRRVLGNLPGRALAVTATSASD